MADTQPRNIPIWERLFGRQQAVQKDWSSLNETQRQDENAKASETFSRLFGDVYTEGGHGFPNQTRGNSIPGTADLGIIPDPIIKDLGDTYWMLRTVPDKNKIVELDRFGPPIKPGKNVFGLRAEGLIKNGYSVEDAMRMADEEYKASSGSEVVPENEIKQGWELDHKLRSAQAEKMLSRMSLVELMELMGKIDPESASKMPASIQGQIDYFEKQGMQKVADEFKTPEGLRKYIAQMLAWEFIPMMNVGARGI